MWQQTWLTVSWNHISELVEFFLFHLPEISLLSTHITLPRSENHAWTCEHNAAFIKSVSRRSWLFALYPGRNTATPRLQQEHYSVNMSLFVNADQTFSCQKRHRFSPVTHVWLQLPEETLLTCSVSLDWLGFWCNSAPIAWWGIRVCTEWSDLMALGGLRSGSLFLFYGLSRAAGSTSSRRTLIIASHLLGHWLLAAFGNGILHIMSPKYPYQSWMRWWTLCS